MRSKEHSGEKAAWKRMGKSEKATNRFLGGLNALAIGFLLQPWLLDDGVSPTGTLPPRWSALFFVTSFFLILWGAGLIYQGLQGARKKGLLLGAGALLLLFYGGLFWGLDRAVGWVFPVAQAGQLDAPNAEIYGWGFAPYQKVNISQPDTGEVYTETLNRWGWRDVDHPLVKAKKRVLLLGDSQIWGPGLRLEETIGRQLQKKLGETYEVFQMGYSNFGTDQQYLVLKEEGSLVQPDFVILIMTISNDIIDNLSEQSVAGNAPKPSFRLDNGKLLARPFHRESPSALRRWLGKSHLCNAFRLLLARLQSMGQATMMHMHYAGRADPQRTWAYNSSFVRDTPATSSLHYLNAQLFNGEGWPPRLKQGWEVTLALLKAMQEEAHKLNAHFVVYPVGQYPAGYRFSKDVCEMYNLENQDPLKPFRKIATFCEKNGIHCIVEPRERREAVVTGEFRFQKDPHMNPKGTELTADLLSEKIYQIESQESLYRGKGK